MTSRSEARASGTPSLSRLVLRRRRLVTRALEVLRAWGYDEAEVPLLVPWDELRDAIGARVAEQLFRFADRDGKLLVLRGDLTPILAWHVARNVPDAALPIRLAYANRIARVQRAFAREQVESYVLGMELIGVSGIAGDLEVICIAADVLAAIGVEDFEIHLGHAGLTAAAISEATPNGAPEVVDALAEALGARDTSLVRRIAIDAGASDASVARLAAMTSLVGDPVRLAELAVGAPEAVATACAALGQAYSDLGRLGLADRLHLDFAARNERGYYTGLRFRILSATRHEAIGSGGRYDRLLERFGRSAPATGFGLRVDRIVAALADPVEATTHPVAVVPCGDDVVAAIDAARASHRAGGRVRLDHGDD